MRAKSSPGFTRGAATLLYAATMAAASVAVGAQSSASRRPRLATVPVAQQSEEQRATAEQFASTGMANAMATYMIHPLGAQHLMPDLQYISSDSTLPPRHRFLLALRTAWVTRSNYLWAHRAADARRAGFTDEDFARIARGPDTKGWDAFEAALLRAADELHVDSFIADATWRMLTTKYDTNQMIDTIDTVGAFTMHADILNSIGVEIEPGYPDRLPSRISASPTATRTNLRLIGKEPRIPPLSRDAPELRNRAGRGGAAGRPAANAFVTFVRNPPADRVRGQMNTHVNNSNSLMPRHRELLLMRIGALCRSEYEWAAHSRIGRQLGMTDADVLRIATSPPGGDPLEAALMRATDELFEHDLVTDATWTTLAASLEPKQLLDVLISVGGYRSNSMLINAAGIQLDANMADYRFPPSLR